MTNDNKSLPFGPSAMFDPSAHESRSGKSALMSEVLDELTGGRMYSSAASRCSIPFKFEFDPKDLGHTVMFGTTRKGMSGMAARTSLLPLSTPSHFAPDVLVALACQREAPESDAA